MVFKTGTDTTNKETDYWFSGPIGAWTDDVIINIIKIFK